MSPSGDQGTDILLIVDQSRGDLFKRERRGHPRADVRHVLCWRCSRLALGISSPKLQADWPRAIKARLGPFYRGRAAAPLTARTTVKIAVTGRVSRFFNHPRRSGASKPRPKRIGCLRGGASILIALFGFPAKGIRRSYRFCFFAEYWI